MSEQQPIPTSGKDNERPLYREDENGQEIVEYLKDASLESPRFQAFAGFVDWKEVMTRKNLTQKEVVQLAMIEETIRQRTNGVKGYRNEAAGMYNLTVPLENAMSKKFNSLNKDSLREDAGRMYALKLNEIKDQEIVKRSQPSQTPPQ